MHPAHLDARERVVRDYTALLIQSDRRAEHTEAPRDLYERIVRAGETAPHFWRMLADRTRRPQYRRPDAETVRWIATLVEAHAQADVAHRLLMDALTRQGAAVAQAAEIGDATLRARRMEIAADHLLDAIGRAASALHVPLPQQQPLRRTGTDG